MTTYRSTIHQLSKFYGFADGLTWRDHEVEIEDGVVTGLRDEDGENWDPTPEQLAQMIAEGVVTPW